MAEEIAKPFRRYQNLSSSVTAIGTTSPRVGERPELKLRESERPRDGGSPATSRTSTGGMCVAGDVEGGNSADDGGGDNHGNNHGNSHKKEGENRGEDSSVKAEESGGKTRPRPPPKLPPKPPGLLEKVMEKGGGDWQKSMLLGHHNAKGQVKGNDHMKGEAKVWDSSVAKGLAQNNIEHDDDSNTKVKSLSVNGNLTDDARIKNDGSKLPSKVKPPVPAARPPVAATRSMQSWTTHANTDSIQRTTSSPIGNKPGSPNPPCSTEHQQRVPMVKSRVHDIQEHLLHDTSVLTIQQKKLSIFEHHIKVSDRRAVFEKIVQDHTRSEEANVVALGVDQASGEKLFGKKSGPVSPTSISTHSHDRSDNKFIVTSKSANDSSSSQVEPSPPTANLHPIPRPRSKIITSSELKESGGLRAPVSHPTPQPRTRDSQILSGRNDSEEIYDKVCELSCSQGVTDVNRSNAMSIASSQEMAERKVTENIYEDPLINLSAEELPQSPPSSPPHDTCQGSLAPDNHRGPPDADDPNATEEVNLTDELGSREHEVIYEVCLSEIAGCQNKEPVPGAVDRTSEKREILQEMPTEERSADQITQIEDEDERNIGTHKLSRQRRQRHFVVKMRPATTEGPGCGPRRTAEMKKKGHSVQEVTQVRGNEASATEEERRDIFQVAPPTSSGEYFIRIAEDEGSDGNDYEEVPSLSSSDEEEEEEEKRRESVTEETKTKLEKKEEDKQVKGDERVVFVEMAAEGDGKGECGDTGRAVFRPNGRAKTSPESIRTADHAKKMKRHSEGAFENFVPLFFKKMEKSKSLDCTVVDRCKSDGAMRPVSQGGAVSENARLLREELDRQLKEKEEEQDQVSSGNDHEPYVEDSDTSSDDDSDYEVVCAAEDSEPKIPPGTGKNWGHQLARQTSGVYNVEENHKALSREGSEQSTGSGSYLVLYDDWKAVEERGRITRRNKGSNERMKRRVFPSDSSSSDKMTTHGTTQGSLDLQSPSDVLMTDDAGVYGSCDRPNSPDAHTNGHRLLKKAGVGLPGIEHTGKNLPDEAPPPIPGRIKLDNNVPKSQFRPLTRKSSRFVDQEPLFQIYQADTRKRDSDVVLRPRTARRSKRPPIPARTFLANKNLPPPLPPHPPNSNRPSPSTGLPPPLPERNIANTSKPNLLNISNVLNTANISSNVSLNKTHNLLDSSIRISLQKELFAKLNNSDSHAHVDNNLPLNNNIRSGDSHKIMDNSRACSGNSIARTEIGAPVNSSDASESSQVDDMEDPTYMSSGNDEGSSSLYSCEDLLGEMDRNRTHGSSMETRSSQQSGDGVLDDDPMYQAGMEDPTYQSGMEDPAYQSGMDDPTYQSGMDDPIYQSQDELEDQAYPRDLPQEDSYDDLNAFNEDEFDDDFDDDDDYYTPPPRDGPISREESRAMRSYWCELPEVVSSGLLANLTPEEKKMQEALFEIITSEASYLRSLNLVVHHFTEAPALCPPHGVLKRQEHHSLFSNIKAIGDISERLLLDLEQHQQESILLSDVCRILLSHLQDQRFEQGFVTYCANNQYQVRSLEQFKNNPAVMAVIRELEANPICCSLDLLSFLMLPFQRITRLPLLLEAVISRAPEGSEMMKNAVEAFTQVRKMALKCNEEAKRMEMIEEVSILARMLDFKQGIKKMDISQNSTIVKRGTLDSIVSQAHILGGKRKAIAKQIHCIVFTEKVLLAKEKIKSDQKRYDVIDWCPRNLVQVQPIDQPSMCSKLADGVPADCHCIFSANLLQNNQRKTAEFILNTKSLSERQRWMDAFCPPSQTEDGERIYESWDCPQVVCITNYVAKDRDELSLEVSDRVDVHKKVEGWCEGVRVGDHVRGWFPASCVQEVVNDHVRARILKKRHKILSMCEEQIRLAMVGPKVK